MYMKAIPSCTFDGCSNLIEVTISPNTKRDIDAFAGCNIQKLNGARLQDCYNGALSITKVTIDDTSGFYNGSFGYCDWEKIGTLPGQVEELTITDRAKFNAVDIHNPSKAIFIGCKSLKVVNISDKKLLEIGIHFKGTIIFDRYKRLCEQRNRYYICGKRKSITGKCKNIFCATGNAYLENLWK